MSYVLRDVVDLVGPLEMWPSYILEWLFCKVIGSSRTARVVLSALFYGNDVHPGTACTIMLMVNPWWDPMIKYSIHTWYNAWRESESERARRTYYNVKKGIVLNLNHELSAYTFSGKFWPGYKKQPLSKECIDNINAQLVHYHLPRLSIYKGHDIENRTHNYMMLVQALQDTLQKVNSVH
jgi:hypothetical protein